LIRVVDTRGFRRPRGLIQYSVSIVLRLYPLSWKYSIIFLGYTKELLKNNVL